MSDSRTPKAAHEWEVEGFHRGRGKPRLGQRSTAINDEMRTGSDVVSARPNASWMRDESTSQSLVNPSYRIAFLLDTCRGQNYNHPTRHRSQKVAPIFIQFRGRAEIAGM